MKKHLVVVKRRQGQETSVGDLGELARCALERIPGVWNCKLLKGAPGEATLSFETEKPELPHWLDAKLADRGMALDYAELCDWHS
ncbi:hypothetical protein [Lysobacter antibioticus]|uniref:Uncharacterized protein n=1 Tax=Lysobacter antibioticus TaxID=84531 RepID=A0A0S2F4U6_LYSAN|nr:hypothetical protein [Lysobacter antibioticus]ALN78569.1 hypothetical protein LA76x_0408 [Lysobacter antibioticus]